jgi:hypothetical protein
MSSSARCSPLTANLHGRGRSERLAARVGPTCSAIVTFTA